MTIIVRLKGGLGNQLFQYAAARGLAQRLGTDFKLDVWHFETQSLRAYRLGAYRIDERIAARDEVAHLTGAHGARPLRWLRRLGQRLKPHYQRTVVVERLRHRYDANMLRVPHEAYLIGYWQNEEYFATVRDAIRSEFQLKNELSPASSRVAQEIDACQAVGVHVRRGDFAEVERTHRVHGVCSRDYYERCAADLRSQLGDLSCFIFTDDPAWARQNLNFGPTTTVVDHNGAQRDYEDLHLLSRCRHFILANSTFSWWAVWLAGERQGRVYAPAHWYANGVYDPTDFIPATWRRM